MSVTHRREPQMPKQPADEKPSEVTEPNPYEGEGSVVQDEGDD